MFKDSNLVCWKEDSQWCKKTHASLDAETLKEATPSGSLTLFDKLLVW